MFKICNASPGLILNLEVAPVAAAVGAPPAFASVEVNKKTF
jgi:hypothetical protein